MPGGDQVQRQGERLLADFQIGSGGTQNSEDVHDELLDDTLGRRRRLEGDEAIEDDQLHVVVALLDDQLDVTLCGGTDR